MLTTNKTCKHTNTLLVSFHGVSFGLISDAKFLVLVVADYCNLMAVDVLFKSAPVLPATYVAQFLLLFFDRPQAGSALPLAFYPVVHPKDVDTSPPPAPSSHG